MIKTRPDLWKINGDELSKWLDTNDGSIDHEKLLILKDLCAALYHKDARQPNILGYYIDGTNNEIIEDYVNRCVITKKY